MNDPFREARRTRGVLECEFQGERLPMLLRHADVREAAKDWRTYSSDAPFRVPIPSEEDVRSVRQLPIETNPPEHTAFRELVEPFFKRAKDPALIARVEALMADRFADAMGRDQIELVREFALPVQSHALTYLLDMPESEAAVWIGWGTHVFRDVGAGERKGAALEAYIHGQIDRARANPGADFFSALVRARYQGRELTRDEITGFANLAFAGGRDTIIHTLTGALGYLGRHPEVLGWLREDPARLVHAGEEFFRVLSPLTHIGRVCPVPTEVHGVAVPAGGRVSLCWSSANHDETVFPAPEETRLDRKPNPHLAFGFGPHLCLGAAHARLLLRTLLQQCLERLDGIEILSARERVEHEARYERVAGYEALTVRFRPRSTGGAS